MKKFNSISLAVISVCAAAMAFTSCNKDEFKSIDGRYVAIQASAETSVETKSMAVEAPVTVDLSEDGVSLFVTSSVSVNTENPFIATKGAEIKSISNSDEFTVLMEDPTGAKVEGTAKIDPAMKDHRAIFKADGTKVEWSEAEGTHKFFATYGSTLLNKTTMAYAGPTGTIDGGADAKNMQDLLLARTDAVHDHATYHNKASYVPLHFYHALAAVRFNVGANVERVIINNVAKDGTITAVEAYDKDTYVANESFKTAISWTAGSAKTSYSQAFSSSVDDMTFYIVPQNIENVTVTFVIKTDDLGERQITARATKLGLGDNKEWKAGYRYNYVVDTETGAGVVDITADTDSKTTNMKRGSVFVRAAVVGNWYKDGKIVAGWNGEVTPDGAWKKFGSYYYYTRPVFGYDTATLLGTLGTTQNVDGADLNVSMFVQAIQWDAEGANLKSAWNLTDAQVNEFQK